MSDTAGLSYKEPDKMDWDNYNPGSRYMAPPQALEVGADGKTKQKVYFGQLPSTIVQEVNQTTELRQYLLDPIKLVRSGESDGYEIRFTRASLKKFTNKKGEPIEASMVGNLLKSVGITAKPQRTVEYDAAMKLAAGKVAAFTIDWTAKNKDTGELIEGYENFPDDPARPGQKKAVLKEGDVYRTKEGIEAKVTSPVLFANARVRFFVDPNRK
jgi:hypothetical protein